MDVCVCIYRCIHMQAYIYIHTLNGTYLQCQKSLQVRSLMQVPTMEDRPEFSGCQGVMCDVYSIAMSTYFHCIIHTYIYIYKYNTYIYIEMCVYTHIYIYTCASSNHTGWILIFGSPNPFCCHFRSFRWWKFPGGTLSGEPAEDLPDLPDVPDLPATVEDIAPVGAPTSAGAARGLLDQPVALWLLSEYHGISLGMGQYL